MEMSKLLLGIDVGGTFTDFVAYDAERRALSAWKSLTTPADPVEGILTGLVELADPGAVDIVRLGTTIVTNALLERSGATIGYITTEGFRDIPFMQRGHRRGHYDARWVKSDHFVQHHNAFEVAERLDPEGNVLVPLDEGQLRAIARRVRDEGEVQAIAVCFLHCYASPAHERRARQILGEELPELPVSISFDVMPRWKEYERASTTIADAYVKPLVSKQIGRLRQAFFDKGLTIRLVMIKWNGGEMGLEAAANAPIHLAVSGPTGGVIAAKHLARSAEIANLVTLDMGGTSTDCATVIAGEETFTTDFEVE